MARMKQGAGKGADRCGLSPLRVTIWQVASEPAKRGKRRSGPWTELRVEPWGAGERDRKGVWEECRDTEGGGPGQDAPAEKGAAPLHPPGRASERTAEAEEPREGSWRLMGLPHRLLAQGRMSEETWAPSYVGVHWNHKAEHPTPVWVLGRPGLVLLW